MTQVHYNRKKTMPKGYLITGLIFGVLLVVSSILIYLYPFASNEMTNYFTGKNPIIYLGEQKGNALLDGDTLYVPYSFMEELDHTIVFDEKSQSIIITTRDKVVQMPSESLTLFINQNPVNLEIHPFINKGGERYVALEIIQPFYPIRYKFLKETNAVLIEADGDILQYGEITNKRVHEEKLRLRESNSLRAPYTAQAKNNETVFIEAEVEDFYFIRKQNGIAGYIEKKFVQKRESKTVTVKHDVKKAALTELDGPVQLTWEAVYSNNPDTAQIPEMPGVNVVSPTWFKIAKTDGTVQNLASIEYVKWAKSRGYQVWALFSNDFNPELTYAVLSDFETRQSVIRQLLHFSQMYQLDGFNIDFENVRSEDGPLVTQFVREATPYFHEAGLYVSMDITFISNSSNWSGFYEREKLADIVDYLVVMAYDEHWASSPVAGSVSSIPWVEKNLIALLKQVPSEKLILGVPLYTRLWKEEQAEDGTITVTSKSMSMEAAKEWLDEHNIVPIYDSNSGQNYAQYYAKDENATYKIWLEDEVSLKKRIELFRKYNLAGIASWSRYFAAPLAWTALQITDSTLVTNN